MEKTDGQGCETRHLIRGGAHKDAASQLARLRNEQFRGRRGIGSRQRLATGARRRPAAGPGAVVNEPVRSGGALTP